MPVVPPIDPAILGISSSTSGKSSPLRQAFLDAIENYKDNRTSIQHGPHPLAAPTFRKMMDLARDCLAQAAGEESFEAVLRMCGGSRLSTRDWLVATFEAMEEGDEGRKGFPEGRSVREFVESLVLGRGRGFDVGAGLGRVIGWFEVMALEQGGGIEVVGI
ncbi:hypothetical protein BJ508DRAFT_309141 [Ascobolus immersus RN42]|uniref:Uncharacterized protein n=1 Tax=Ascobolus immersus RN42 TaxID=1160509 RepID=A0A3N4HXB2_ASCIM|nr:hypothetical protein BJ508DRAFT_309141 [Ascobolus immersus RN42]